MPCDTINTASVTLGKADPKMVSAAMQALGYWEGNWSLSDGQLKIRGQRSSEELTAQIKREVTRQTVVAQAKRFGWSVKTTDNGKLQLLKARL